MQKELYNELKNWGCDIDNAMERFMGDKELYETCLKVTAYDENFDALCSALEKEDVQEAFRKAHSLKGVIGNMGIEPMYSIVCVMVEALRKGELNGMLDKYNELIDKKNLLCDIIRRNDNEDM